MSANRYEVAILGSGIGGSMLVLASILAKRGVSTLLLEGASHPRFTIDESLIHGTGIRLRIIGEKYGVPEVGWTPGRSDVRRRPGHDSRRRRRRRRAEGVLLQDRGIKPEMARSAVFEQALDIAAEEVIGLRRGRNDPMNYPPQQ